MKSVTIFSILFFLSSFISAQTPDSTEAKLKVDKMPRFEGCENIDDETEAKSCFESKFFAFLGDHLVYPKNAKRMGVTGKVFVSFIVEKDGSITNITILRDIGGGCGDELVRVIKLLPKMKPGYSEGKPARVQYRLPINFALN